MPYNASGRSAGICRHSWRRGSQLQILCGVSLPDPVQNLLADAVVRRQGLLRLYDVQPIVYALIRYRARIRAELQSRKRAATDLTTADIGGDVEQAAFALYQRFLSR